MKLQAQRNNKFIFARTCVVLAMITLVVVYLYWSSGFHVKRLRNQSGKIKTLVLIPGHGIYVDGKWNVAGWLEKFVPAIQEQIRVAVSEYDPGSCLVMFGGGMTNAQVGRISEGASYKQAALDMGLANAQTTVAEEYARDSYENVLFSLCRFKQLVGEYPTQYVVVGFEFKRERFVKRHREAVQFPRSKFAYRGVPAVPLDEIQEQLDMERQGTIMQFEADPHGCEPPLSTKRRERDPFHRGHPYAAICPELSNLFKICG